MDILGSISVIKNFMGNAGRNTCNDYLHEALNDAVKCMEKQIPKKPKFIGNKFRHRGQKIGELTTLELAYDCPNCRLTLWETNRDNYCRHCGQALDWSKDES